MIEQTILAGMIYNEGYVGITNKTPEIRFNEHKKLALKGSPYTISKAIRKYGDKIILTV